MYTAPIPQSAVSESNLQGAKRLDQDPILKERFANLLSGVQKGLESGQTALKPAEKTNLENDTKDLKQKIVKDVVSIEKGIRSILELTDDTANKNLEIENKDELGPLSEVFFDYSRFTTNYFVATKYVHNSAESASEEIQIFSKGR